jgi:flagellar basal-body rod modification protein FlgD
MSVDATSNNNPVSPTNATPPADKISSRSAALGQADFLQMLTAQLKSQDPLNPMNGADFATQLAQFTSVQQLTAMNSKMDQSVQASLMMGQTFSNTMSASLIGKEVKADMNQFSLTTGGGHDLHYNLANAATSITIDIKDSTGNVVRTLQVNPQAAGDQTVTWNGMDGNGKQAAGGDYTYTVTAKDANGAAVTASTFIQGVVSALQYVDGNAVLIVNGMQVSLSSVLSVMEPTGKTKG